MYIQPETNIRILRNVPLDTTYEHTIYFGSKTAQYNYFAGLTKYNLTNYTYQRVKRGVCRVGIKADNLYDCNYMMFQNKAYGDKWFYAYITSVEFVNNECAEISFELDVIQTWFFDCEPDYCFVEREHSVTDKIGENIVPENVDCGEYVYNGYGKITQALDSLCIIVVIGDLDEAPEGTVYDGVFGGCSLYAYNMSDTEAIREKLDTYSGKPDSIVSMYMSPTIGVGVIPTGGVKITRANSAEILHIESEAITSDDTLDGYMPRNLKMYTYPYNFLSIETSKQSNIFRYEFFPHLKPLFDISVPITQPVQVALRAKNYKGSGNNTLNSYTLVLDEYPMCSWNTDAFKAWLAQNALPMQTVGSGLIAGLALGVAGVALPGLAVAGGVAKALSLLNQGYKASVSSDIIKGSTSSGNIDVANGTKTFYGGRCSVNAQYAKMIDNYFTMFGYATKTIKKPNRNSRPHWNYVKTIGATITGSVPADDMRKICQIYDAGITFWKHGSEVGRYDLDNSV